MIQQAKRLRRLPRKKRNKIFSSSLWIFTTDCTDLHGFKKTICENLCNPWFIPSSASFNLSTLPFHPFSVHFPIALLLTAGGIYLHDLIRPQKTLGDMGKLLHVIGIAGMLLAILSGNLAKSELEPTESYEAILWQHEWMSYVVLWLFTMILAWQHLRQKQMKRTEMILFVLAFLIATIVMLFSASLGGEMVYEFGVGKVN